MNASRISEFSRFIFSGDGYSFLEFVAYREFRSKKPICHFYGKPISRVVLSHFHFEESDILHLKSAFYCDELGIIWGLPEDMTLDSYDGIAVLKFGDTAIDPHMLEITELLGMTSYFDSSNLIFCATKEFEPFLLSIVDFLEPGKVMFDTSSFGSSKLIIRSI